MGEKGNLLDMGEEIFANLAEQGPQFWLNYEQYKLSRAQGVQAGVVVGGGWWGNGVGRGWGRRRGGRPRGRWGKGGGGGGRGPPDAGGARPPRSTSERGVAAARPWRCAAGSRRPSRAGIGVLSPVGAGRAGPIRFAYSPPAAGRDRAWSG